MSGNRGRALPAAGAEILWDEWGVPHIFAADDPSLFRAFGWAQMHSHGDLILRLYGQARGRGAEYWGESELASDRLTRTMGFPNRARDWLEAQSPHFRRNLDAFADGMNTYAARFPERLADDVRLALPVDPADVLGHFMRVLFTFLTLNGQAANPNQPLQIIGEGLPFPPGSNAWAIGPPYSTSGHTLLLANPHLPWSDFWLWYEAQLVSPGIDVYGAALVGSPAINIGFNDHLGWSYTVNTHNGWTAYQLTPDGDGYRWDGAVRPFEIERQTITVRLPDGGTREEELVIQRSIHGPVVAESDGRPVAIRVVGVDQIAVPRISEQWWEMGRARSLAEFEAALRRMQAPMFNVVYADRDGHVMYLFSGLVPERATGDWDAWTGLIPGDTSETLWTTVHPFDDLPRVVDPPSAWVQNSNSPPWLATFPTALDPQAFPPYLAPRRLGLREQRGIRMLLEHGPLSFEDLLALHGSTRSALADAVLPDLIAAARAHGGPLAHDAAGILDAWDRHFEPESIGAPLFALWLMEMLPEGTPFTDMLAVPWDPAAPLDTPRGLANPRTAAAALESAAAKLRSAAGSLGVPWGALFRLRHGSVDLPGHGSRDPMGVFRVTSYVPADDGRFTSSGGTSFVAAVEFADPMRAMALIAYGNASQPESPHIADQLPLYARKDLRPVWRDRPEIEAHLEAREVIAPPDG